MGTAFSMNTVLKNNRKMRAERASFKEINKRYAGSRVSKVSYKEAPVHVVRYFRKKTIEENRVRDRKIAITFILLFTIMITTFFYVLLN